MKLFQTHFYDCDYHEYKVFTDWAENEEQALDAFHKFAKQWDLHYTLAMARPVTVRGKEIYKKDVE